MSFQAGPRAEGPKSKVDDHKSVPISHTEAPVHVKEGEGGGREGGSTLANVGGRWTRFWGLGILGKSSVRLSA